MRLQELLLPFNLSVSDDCDILHLQNDSRQVKKGDVFIAYKGALTDGRLYMEKAREAGAVAIIYDPDNCPVLPSNILCIPLPDLAHQLSALACRFYKQGQSALTITGVTGTNGKTTIAYQLAQAHQLLGHPSAYIGTLGQGPVSQLKTLENTTPDALCLQQLLQDYAQKSLQQVCMEVSSHALALGRVQGIPFHQAIFTNLTQDHLDFHQNMDNYAAAKAQLFADKNLRFAIGNQDDPWFPRMREALQPETRLLTYGLQSESDIVATDWHMDLMGTHIAIRSPWGTFEVQTRSLGKFNVYNTLALISSLLACNYSPEKIAAILPRLQPAPGRMEIVADHPSVVVDYAHTPDALANVLLTLHAIKKTGKLWVIFGCGGDRDKTKRPLMGKAASTYADEIILTSDNPRNEMPEQIVEDIMPGIATSASVRKIYDRKTAIIDTLEQAKAGDIVLIAGKGHENYQQIGQIKRPFSDQTIVRDFMKIRTL